MIVVVIGRLSAPRRSFFGACSSFRTLISWLTFTDGGLSFQTSVFELRVGSPVSAKCYCERLIRFNFSSPLVVYFNHKDVILMILILMIIKHFNHYRKAHYIYTKIPNLFVSLI